MGSFNQTAFLSNLPITPGRETALVFLLPNKYSKKSGHAIYAHDNFRPALLPVYGEYDDYGKIENVVRDFNVECIEKYFGIGIDEIIEYVDDRMIGRRDGDEAPEGVNPNALELLDNLVFTMEYAFYFKGLKQHFKRAWYNEGDTTQYVLEDLFGLAPDKKQSGDKRYKTRYAIPNSEYAIHHDGHWGHIVDGKGKQVQDIASLTGIKGLYGPYQPKNYVQALTALSGIDYAAKLTEEQRTYSYYAHSYAVSVVMDDIYKKRKADAGESVENKIKREMTPESIRAILGEDLDDDRVKSLMKSLNRIVPGGLSDYKGESSLAGERGRDSSSQEVIDFYNQQGTLLDPRLKDALLEYLDIEMVFGWNSLTWKLASYGNQDYHLEFHRAMAQSVVDYTTERIREYKEENGDEDDEDNEE